MRTMQRLLLREAPTTALHVATAMFARDRRHQLVPHARIDIAVGQVDDQVHHDDDRRRVQREELHDREVTDQRGLEEPLTKPLDADMTCSTMIEPPKTAMNAVPTAVAIGVPGVLQGVRKDDGVLAQALGLAPCARSRSAVLPALSCA